MSEVIQGILKKVNNKPIPPDNYGNTNRLSILVQPEGASDGTWISLGTTKTPGLSVKKGKDWIEVSEGSKLAVVAEQNGEYWNAKRSGVSLLGNPVQKPSEAPQSNPSPKSYTPTSTGVDWARKDAGAAASASVDKALVLLTSTGYLHPGEGNGWKKDVILETARTMQEIVVELADEILGVNVDATKSKSAPTGKPVSKGTTRKTKAEDFEEDEESPF